MRQHVAIEGIQSEIMDVGDEHAFAQIIEHDHARAASDLRETLQVGVATNKLLQGLIVSAVEL